MGTPSDGRRCAALALAVLLGAGCAGVQAQVETPTRTLQSDFLDFLNPVAVMGEVNKPGEYHLIPNLTLAQLLDIAGGLTKSANGLVVVVHFADNPPFTPPSRAQLVPLMRPGAAVPPNVSLRRIPIADRAALNKETK